MTELAVFRRGASKEVVRSRLSALAADLRFSVALRNFGRLSQEDHLPGMVLALGLRGQTVASLPLQPAHVCVGSSPIGDKIDLFILVNGDNNVLGDLDELVMLCRNDQARTHIGEAIRSYKAAAYRSTIVMTWIAVVHDLVDKLRELAEHGDQAATQRVEEHDRFHRAGDVMASLRFERNLLKTVMNDFQLISSVEFADLDRIQQDRHRCAHPSLSVDGEPFAPTAELARAHIRSAVEYVLRREPAQGRYALDMVLRQVAGDYFPLKMEQVTSVLSATPLLKGRESLVRSFMVVCIKKLLQEKSGTAVQRKYRHCLRFIKAKRRDVFERYLPGELSRLARPLDIATHGWDMLNLCRVKGVWDAYPIDVRTSLTGFVEHVPADTVDRLEFILDQDGLAEACTTRIKKLTAKEAHELAWYEAPDALWEHVVASYVRSDSFADANLWAQQIWNHKKKATEFRMTAQQAHSLCQAVIENRQVREATRVGWVLAVISAAGHAPDNWEEALQKSEADPVKIAEWSKLAESEDSDSTNASD